MSSLLERVGALLLERRHDGDRSRGIDGGASAASPAFGAVLGSTPAAVPVAAACANELRAQARAAAAVLCVWGAGETPAGATTPAARRIAARLDAAELPATARGRLAWLALAAAPDAAAAQVERARARLDVPLVLALAGPRPAAFEPLLACADVAVAVLPADADEALLALARAALPACGAALVVPPLAAGPSRWAALAGIARLRTLRVAASMPGGGAQASTLTPEEPW